MQACTGLPSKVSRCTVQNEGKVKGLVTNHSDKIAQEIFIYLPP